MDCDDKIPQKFGFRHQELSILKKPYSFSSAIPKLSTKPFPPRRLSSPSTIDLIMLPVEADLISYMNSFHGMVPSEGMATVLVHNYTDPQINSVFTHSITIGRVCGKPEFDIGLTNSEV